LGSASPGECTGPRGGYRLARWKWLHESSQSKRAFLKSDRDLRLHTLVEVSIALPPPSSRTAVIKAYVSRKFKEGVGIEWCEFAPSIIKDLVRSASRSPL
jgi:hypothetical protein